MEELLARPLAHSVEGLSSQLTDCAALALQIRLAILGMPAGAAELEGLAGSSDRISALMGEIRQRLDGFARRSST